MTFILPSRTARIFVKRELQQNLPSTDNLFCLNLAGTTPTTPHHLIITGDEERAPWTRETQTCLSISANGGIRTWKNLFEMGESLGKVREVKLTVSSDKNTLGSE